jgi:hypothetical protein
MHKCSVLQCFAVCCSVLQCVAVCCRVLQCVSRVFSVRFQCVAVGCSVSCALFASCYLAHARLHTLSHSVLLLPQPCRAVCWSVSQCVAECCSVLPCVAVRGAFSRPLANLGVRSLSFPHVPHGSHLDLNTSPADGACHVILQKMQGQR